MTDKDLHQRAPTGCNVLWAAVYSNLPLKRPRCQHKMSIPKLSSLSLSPPPANTMYDLLWHTLIAGPHPPFHRLQAGNWLEPCNGCLNPFRTWWPGFHLLSSILTCSWQHSGAGLDSASPQLDKVWGYANLWNKEGGETSSPDYGTACTPEPGAAPHRQLAKELRKHVFSGPSFPSTSLIW